MTVLRKRFLFNTDVLFCRTLWAYFFIGFPFMTVQMWNFQVANHWMSWSFCSCRWKFRRKALSVCKKYWVTRARHSNLWRTGAPTFSVEAFRPAWKSAYRLEIDTFTVYWLIWSIWTHGALAAFFYPSRRSLIFSNVNFIFRFSKLSLRWS